ncbi:MAG: PEP/pyruvate-binding domain-containing protein [Solirubrobacterales bacterium]
MTSIPVVLAEAREEGKFGGKAVQLGAAIRAGLPVPDGFALSYCLADAVAADHDASVAALLVRFRSLGGPVSVRSSGIGEDSGQTSFAGQHATVLNVRHDDEVVAAVKEVHASAHGETALAYRQMLGIEGEPRIGVVVQRLVEPETAGVLFTRHPVSGADERVIDASWGLGEAVVGSIVAPDHYRLDRDGTVLERTPGRKDIELRILPGGGIERCPVAEHQIRALCLSDADLAALDDLATACEGVYEGDQDIEWAIAAGRVWLLQRRPLTAIGGIA